MSSTESSDSRRLVRPPRKSLKPHDTLAATASRIDTIQPEPTSARTRPARCRRWTLEGQPKSSSGIDRPSRSSADKPVLRPESQSAELLAADREYRSGRPAEDQLLGGGWLGGQLLLAAPPRTPVAPA